MSDGGESLAATETHRVNILLVDDDARNLDVLDSVLARPDYRLVRARTANEALLALVGDEFAVIVLDIHMPDLDGFKLAEIIKQRKRTQHIPIIFLTAYYQEDKDVLQGYGAGAVDYLSKPVNPLILKSKVDVFVDLFRKTHALTKLNQAMETEIEQRVEQIRASLREKETLLKEIHHRVKNNLQVISSLLSLQSDKLADTTARKLFHDARDRVRSMALVHEKLYNSHDLARVELGEYTRSLMGDLLQAHSALASKVRLRIEQDAVFVPVDVAIPCGLILNELATNALKHAFHERAEGEITIETKRLDDGRIRVVFSDDGRGLPPELDWRSADTLGLRLIRMLVEQLGGASELCNGQGTRFELTLNARSYIDDGRGEGR
ncbi:MAG: response regulator [Deltaproteobacteria bacterium]|nr:MAG: response regulator [Deltaproteobacteria bacterium]